MFTNLELFPNEKETYRQTIIDISESSKNEIDKVRRLEEAEVKYKGQVRKYLPAALDVIKNVFGYQYSIYKVGKDFNASFEVIETNVRKTKSEIEAEMKHLKSEMAGMSLTQEQIHKVELAMDVLITYNDDAVDFNDVKLEEYLKRTKVVASSIIEPITPAAPVNTAAAASERSVASPVAETPTPPSTSAPSTTDDVVGMSIFNVSLSDASASSSNQSPEGM